MLSEEDLVNRISLLVISGLDQFNVKSSMSDSQIEIFAYDFLRKYGYESFEDLILMFRFARNGDLGEHYQSIDNMQLMKWFQNYLEIKYDHKEKDFQGKKYIPRHSDNKESDLKAVKNGYERIARDQERVEKEKKGFRSTPFEKKLEHIRLYASFYLTEDLEQIYHKCSQSLSPSYKELCELVVKELNNRGIEKEIPKQFLSK